MSNNFKVEDYQLDLIVEALEFYYETRGRFVSYDENMELRSDIDQIKRDIISNLSETKIGDFSDGYHTFNQLYHQRAMLFAALVNQHKDKAWKTHYHEDGEPCFGGGWFLVTIDTPLGAYGYHYEDKYWDLFECEELPKAKHWDGYTEADVSRLLSLSNE